MTTLLEKPLANSRSKQVEPRWFVGIAVAATAFALVVMACWSRSYPPVPKPLTFSIVFPAGAAGNNEPLISTGTFGAADFLSVKYASATDAVLTYDSWGRGGPSSMAFPLQPGTSHVLQVEMPTLSHVQTIARNETRPLRVLLDGREIMNEVVMFHARAPDEIYFGVNPIGGLPAGRFRGQLFAGANVPLRGRPTALFSNSARVFWMMRHFGWQLAFGFVASIVVGFTAMRLPIQSWAQKWNTAPAPSFIARSAPPHLTFVVCTLLCIALFAALITGGTFRFIYPDAFGQFFDHQAASLLKGRLDVPESAVGGEAFIVGGKYYGYFGVTPAILRLPFVAAQVGFCQLTRSFMVMYFGAALTASYLLLCWATKTLCGRRSYPSRWAVIILLLCAGLGSTLFFLGARAYVYHEAILCGAAFALWSTYFSLRYLDEPEQRWWVGAVLCGLLAVHARPPAGLFALFLLGCATVYLMAVAWRHDRRGSCRHAMIGVAAAAAFLSFNGMSYLKFGTFDGSPLRYSVQYRPERLAKFDGKNFHVSNLGHNFNTYILEADFRFATHLPWVRFGSLRHHRVFPEAKIDLAEPAVALPYAMCGLFVLALAGSAWALLWAAQLRIPVVLLWIGVAPMALALMAAIVTSHRYTGDFCAFLIAAAACGLAVFDSSSGTRRNAFLLAASVFGAASVFVTASLAWHFQGELVWGVPSDVLHNHKALRAVIDTVLGNSHP